MRWFVFLGILSLSCISVAQQQPDPKELVSREFGKSFTVAAGIAPMFGDLDNDGREDAVIVVTSSSPLVDAVEYHYKPIDPYNSFWGWGNPRDTVQFSATSVGPPNYLAIVHDWRAPKAKFLVINLPFERLALSRVLVKKKAVTSIHASERSLDSDLFWDGKKYKWEPTETH